MRSPALLALLLALAPGFIPAAAADSTGDHAWPPANHSASVASVLWTPGEPKRGDAVVVTVALVEGVNATPVLRACRVQAYSCLQPQFMEPVDATNGTEYRSELAWRSGFFRDVTRVGVNIRLQHANGSIEHSPTTDWPNRPAELPSEADVYYYYGLPAGGASPGLAAASTMAAVILLALVGWRRR